MRKHPLSNGYTYHVFTKSIPGFKVFRSDKDFNRMIELFKFYRVKNLPTRFSAFFSLKHKECLIKNMRKVLDSYTRYFNIKTKRKGPLWQSKFKSVLVKNDEQLLHLTRYLHLYPISNNLV